MTPRTSPGMFTMIRHAGCFAGICFGLMAPGHAANPAELIPLNLAAPNYASIFPNGVKTGDPVAQPDSGKAGEEILLAVYAYLAPDSPVRGDTAYRDRLLLLLDDRFGRWAAGSELRDIASIWQASYAYFLLKAHRPDDISPPRAALYDSAVTRNQTSILADSPLLYNDGPLAQVWLNGDIRLAMALHFGALALDDAATAEKARAALDNVMTRTALADGGTHYVGFWGEVATYHDESVRCLIWWWKITGSPAAKACVDATLRYAVVANEPDGFTEQSSNIPYKHMYNNIHGTKSALWKAYLYNDGYNYFYGAPEETASSTELLNVILHQPERITRVPPANPGVFFDGNVQGPRGRFNGAWGWIANGRDVQHGGPEELALIDAQGYEGRQCGKATFVGAFALGAVANKTSLKGALDTVLVEFKESAGEETDLMRGSKYRYLAQDEQTRTITRKNFGTLSTSYRISKRTSSAATPDWSAGATDWTGQQLWVMTGERIIGLVQVASTAATTVYGLDARLVFSGGRRGIMGSYFDLMQPDATSFAFGDLRAKIHGGTFGGNITQQRLAISDPSSTDDFSALARIHDAAILGDDAPVEFPSGTRRWLVIDVTRDGTAFANPVINVLPANSTWAVLQFAEGARKIRIVQNLTASERSYTGNFVVGSTYAATTLHRSWNDALSNLPASNGTSVVKDTVPAYGHMIAVNSDQPEDHALSRRTSAEVYGAAAYVNTLPAYAFGAVAPVGALSNSRLQITFPRLRPDVDYTVQASGNLAGWSNIATNPGATGMNVTASDPVSMFDAGSRFLRLRLAVPPPP